MEESSREHICIVGNSASVKGKGLGAKINEFNNVCRINDWVINGFQEDVGTKITHWVSGVGKQIPSWSKGRALGGKYTILLWPYQMFSNWSSYCEKNHGTDGSFFEAVPRVKQEVLRRLGYKLSDFSIWKDNDSSDIYDTRDNITFVPHYVCQKIARSTVAYPTTGLATIAYFKFVLHYNVYTIGFDFFLKNKDHYWDGEEGNACDIEFHDLEAEKAVYDSWISEGLIKEL
jgi:hypothetical protein